MTLKDFMNEAISPWMREKGPDDDIVLSSRIRLARNLSDVPFPTIANHEDLEKVRLFIEQEYKHQSLEEYKNLQFISMRQLSSIEKRVLVEKHLISPHLAKYAQVSGTLLST